MDQIQTLPTYEINSFARWVANAAEQYFENPDVKRRFKEWQESKQINIHKNAEMKNSTKTVN